MGPLEEATFYYGAPATSEAALFTVPAGEDWIVDHVLLVNTTATGTYTVTVDVVPPGGAAGAGTKLADALVVAANSTVPLASATQNLGLVLEAGTTVEGAQSEAAAINVIITGRVRTH